VLQSLYFKLGFSGKHYLQKIKGLSENESPVQQIVASSGLIALRAIQNSKFKIQKQAMTRFQALLMS